MLRKRTLSLFVLAGILFGATAATAESGSIALYGKPKYTGNWQHFDYVNPNAPKGGRIVLPAYGTFDNFNPFIFKGIAATQVASLTMDALAFTPDDDITAAYPLIAKKFDLTDDYIEFFIDERARFADGSKITADDVIFSYRSLVEKGSPLYKIYYADVDRAKKTGALSVRFYFKKGSNNKELPLILSQMLIYSAKDWEGKDFAKPYLEAPLGSGICRPEKAFSTLTKSATTIIRTRPLPCRPCFRAILTSARNILPKSGPPDTTTTRSKTAKSSKRRFPTAKPRGCKILPSISAGRSLPTVGCAKPSAWPLTLNGQRKICFIINMSA